MAPSSLKLRRARARARSEGAKLSLRSLTELAQSPQVADRLFALAVLWDWLESNGPRAQYLKLARPLIRDRDNDCRWQALVVVGEFVRTDPEAVWRVAKRFGSSMDTDMRTGVATVLLKHLFEHHPRYRSEAAKLILRGNARLRDTFNMCWDFGPARPRKS
jgi:hypothetical protein